MPRIVWHQMGQTSYETGVDRGVFYDSENKGYAWSGLVNVEESSVGGEIQSFHYDGIKYLDRVSPRNYQAVLSAFSAPNSFIEAIGNQPAGPGLILTRQKRSLFGLVYRTHIQHPRGYKIHLVYNVLATPTSKGYSTIDEALAPEPFSWQINAIPTKARMARPTAHYILDSTKMQSELLAVFEDILYGTEDDEPRLPSVDELLDLLMAEWEPVSITAQTTTGLSELTPDGIDLSNSLKPGINRALPNTRLVPSSISGLYRLE